MENESMINSWNHNVLLRERFWVLILDHLFQQVIRDFPAFRISFVVELNLEVLSLQERQSQQQENYMKSHKATWIIVPQSLCISKGFQQRVGLQEDIFHSENKSELVTELLTWSEIHILFA